MRSNYYMKIRGHSWEFVLKKKCAFKECLMFLRVLSLYLNKLAVGDMKKVIKSFADSKRFFIFADANEKMGGNARFDILHDRLTDCLTLLNLGNSTNRVNHELVKASLVSSTKDTDCFTIFLTQGNSQNQTRRICEEGVSF